MSGILESSYELRDHRQSLSHYLLPSVFYKLKI
ncbi:hypothetical protein F383_15232 [Gossypium arboreum]|uniref:Uncharacterized protein n=1 Tax=Gossypium arboreum TaxID=29729 RepID=A0A0B0PVR4_GOSAR|nr:hypothetical protein F383_15232 [Gossypium arboreum]